MLDANEESIRKIKEEYKKKKYKGSERLVLVHEELPLKTKARNYDGRYKRTL